jgi:hypothetical protein
MPPMTSAPWVAAVLCCLIVTTLIRGRRLPGRRTGERPGRRDGGGRGRAVLGVRRFRPCRAAAEADPAAWADLNSRFDNRAALAFYRELSELPPDFLVNNLPCPLFAFWGEEDEEIARGGGVRLLAAGLVPASNNTNRSPVIAGPVIDLG